MKVFVDTNVILDVALKRAEFFEHSRLILDLGWTGKLSLATTSVSVVNAQHIIERYGSKIAGVSAVIQIVEIFEILNSDKPIIQKALASEPLDFEDAAQYFSAKAAGCEVIISRDKEGFKAFDIPCFTPKEFLERCFNPS